MSDKESVRERKCKKMFYILHLFAKIIVLLKWQEEENEVNEG